MRPRVAELFDVERHQPIGDEASISLSSSVSEPFSMSALRAILSSVIASSLVGSNRKLNPRQRSAMTNTARRAAVDKVGFARSLRPCRPQSTRKTDLTKLHHVLGREQRPRALGAVG